jgi:hypothetical protein
VLKKRQAERLEKARLRWKVGDRVSFSASPSNIENRRVYTGTIERIEGDLAMVRDDGWHAISAVRLDYCHTEGAYEIFEAGPRGMRWTDEG